MSNTKITVETIINAPLNKVWDCWTLPQHITQWNAASDDWHCPKAENDLKEGGKFSFTMASKDGKMSFDFEGVYTAVVVGKAIAYTMFDQREAVVTFSNIDNQTKITEVFEAENMNPIEMQQMGWQAILNNFKRYVEQQQTA